MDADILKTATAIFGAVTGSAALIWRFIDEFATFLRISVQADSSTTGWLKITTTVENRGNRAKEITNAFVLIGPESDNPIETVRKIAHKIPFAGPIDFTNDFNKMSLNGNVLIDGCCIVPLEFYYSENVDISDETLTYSAIVSTDAFMPGTPYSVRFFVFGPRRLHRSTQDSFVFSEAQNKAD